MGKYRGKRKLSGSRPDSVNGRPTKRLKIKEPAGLNVIYENLKNKDEFIHGLHSLGALAADGADAVSAILDYTGGEEAGEGALVRNLAPYLMHEQLTARLAAVGALRNLTACGNEEFVERLLECDLFKNENSPLCQLLRSYSKDSSTPSPAADQKEEYWAALEQASYVLYNICEVSEDAVSTATCNGIVSVLSMHCSTCPPTALTLAVNTALLCLTETNPRACSALEGCQQDLGSTVVSCSTDAAEPLALHNALTVAGILINLGQCGTSSPHLRRVIALIGTAMSVPPTVLLQEHTTTPDDAGSSSNGVNSNGTSAVNVAAAAPMMEVVEETRDDIERIAIDAAPTPDYSSNDAATAEQQLIIHLEHPHQQEPDNGCLTAKNWTVMEHRLGSQQLALELLNNICCGDDDSEAGSEAGKERPGMVNWEEEEEAGRAREEMMSEGDCEWEDDNTEAGETLRPLLVEHHLFDRVLQSIQPLGSALKITLQGSKYWKLLHTTLSVQRVRALSSVCAVVEVLQLEQLGGPQRLFSCWTDLRKLACATDQGEADDGLLEGATGAMRAVVGKFTGAEAEHLSAITLQDLQLLFFVGLNCPVAGVKDNLARLLGTLCSQLMSQRSPQDLVREPVRGVLVEATDFLLKLAGTVKELWVCAEALDALIDLYTPDSTDQLALECKLVDRLENINNYYAARYKKQKKSCPREFLGLIDTVRENLPEFIKYKEPRILNIAPGKKHPCKGGSKGKKDASGGAGGKEKSKPVRRK